MTKDTVIGLEVHVALDTKSKLFCRCSTQWGLPDNTAVCPICLGHPGTLPVLNARAVELAVVAALALDCKINAVSSFARKNYFYPDLPKGYQITQQQQPLARHGSVKFQAKDVVREISIRQVHIEEDAARLYHHKERTEIDFNRAGVPLIEIVTEPEFSRPGDARLFLEELRLLLIAAGVSDCRMEAGNMRCDANISFAPDGQRTEIKNLNSTKAVQLALEYQQQNRGTSASQSFTEATTVRWDEKNRRTVIMRSKSESPDYMFIAEPDLPNLCVEKSMVEALQNQIPETPLQLSQRLAGDYQLNDQQARVLAAHRDKAAWFEKAVAAGAPPAEAAKWLLGPVARHLNLRGKNLGNIPISPEQLARLIKLQTDRTISNTEAREILQQMLVTGHSPESLKKEMNLGRRWDEQTLAKIIGEVLAANRKAIADYRAGKDRALDFLTGKVLQRTEGRADPAEVTAILRQHLDK